MRLYQADERSVGICESCGCKVSTRMEYRDYTPTGSMVTVPDVLVAVCEHCKSVVGIPHQSTPKINRCLKVKPPRMKPIAVRVSRVLEEVLDLVAASVGAVSSAMNPAICRYYMSQVASSPAVAEEVRSRSRAPLAIGDGEYVIAMKVGPSQLIEVTKAMKAAGIRTKADLLRGIIMLAAEDCGITYRNLDRVRVTQTSNPSSKARRDYLKSLALTIG